MRGPFVSLEGGEGAGKSTQISYIRQWFEDLDHEVVVTREPGGTPLAELIREVVLHGDHPEMTAHTELLLIFAARAQHVSELILPALEEGKCVICDRFTDASFAYQGGGRGLPRQQIEALEDMVMGELRPDLTLLLDLTVEAGLERAADRGSEDRFETEAFEFLERAHDTYLERAREYSERYVVIDASSSPQRVWNDIRQALEERFQ